jgi:hypothetical protein
MLLRLVMIAAILPVLSAQTPSADPAPINVTAHMTWPVTSAPELSITLQNISGRNIQGYTVMATFTDPDTGVTIKREPIGVYRSPSLGIQLGPGEQTRVIKSVPLGSSGMPANYTFDLDLVFFDDGSTWGPAQTGAAKVQLGIVEEIAKIMNAQPK